MEKKSQTNPKIEITAVGLMSGGLDSVLAVKIISNLGIKVFGITFILPWKSYDNPTAIINAEDISIPIVAQQLDDEFLELIKNPNHGYGSAINPCIDCKIFMLKKAEAYRKQIKADFLFTGEVLGQRPMSQNSRSLKLIEKESGLINQIVRPLSAQLLDPTEAEIKGLIDRKKMLGLNGRSRKGQLTLAEKYHIKKYSQPAGGCHLTEKSFARRLRDYYENCTQNYKETESLMYGRHYRIDKTYKAILGRNAIENDRLLRSASPNDFAFKVEDGIKVGPLCLLKGGTPNNKAIHICGGLIKKHSKHKNDPSLQIKYWPINDSDNVKIFSATNDSDSMPKNMEI